ncbi:MAG TPA: zinc-dependent metalloprotease family protein [Pyrinomonadaceae bacterium]|nr:zinc-dependent metalloprotease family protein [Pyrinomonadaceae bacterium]
MRNGKAPRAVLLTLLVVSVTAAAVFVSPASSGQARGRVREDVGRALRDFDELRFDTAALLSRARKEGRLSLRTSRGTFELNVEPFDIRADNYRAVAAGGDGGEVELERAPARWFRGEVVGVEGSRARFVLDETEFQGVIVTPGETYFVEPAADFSDAAARGDFVFYAASAVKPSAGGGECGTLAERVGAEAAKHGGATASAKGGATDDAFAPKPETDVATESDFEFTQTFSASASPADAANNDILNVIAAVDAIYDAQLGVKLRVVFQRAWTTNADPYTLTAASPALSEFRDAYNANPPAGLPPHDLVHMFTGKDMDGSTIGIAFRGVVCSAPPFAYGISQSKFNSSTVLRVALTAHEMGHNFGATHPNQESPVPQGCNGVANVMNSFIQPTSDFCQLSRDQMTNHVSAEGSCLTRLTRPGCAYSISPASQFFAAAGGAGAVDMTTGAGCDWGLAEGAEWIDANVPAVNGPGTAFYNVQPNTNTGPREASADVAGQTLKVRQAASPSCTFGGITIGQTAVGSLDTTDCRSGQPERPNAFIDLYTFAGRAGQQVRIEMNAEGALDTFLYLFGPDGSILTFNDDIVSGTQTNSRIPLEGFFTLPSTGVYTVEATSFSGNVTGRFTLSVNDNSPASTVGFTGNAFSVSEAPGAGGLGSDGAGFRVVNVTRAGDASGTATVDFATFDGTAERRKDYEQTLGTLVFAPGETGKSFTVFVDDDASSEGAETVNLTLSNPVGVTLGATPAATLTIDSNDTASGSSPVRAEGFDAAFFVRQQYLDFLNREPDAAGFAFWQNELNSCGAGAGAAQCREVKRINVSGAFFLSIEFQNTGYFAYRTYKAAYGDATSPGVSGTVPVIRLEEFLPDTQRIGQGLVVGQGNWQAQLEANKQAYALEFVQRQRFLTAYPLTQTPAQFVDKLRQNTGTSLSQAETAALVAQLTSNNTNAGRAAVLRAVAEDGDLQQAEKNRAFVLMQYYGYLRRNPNDAPEPTLNYAGWKFWLDKLNQFGGDFVNAEMVKAFLSSSEYRQRFGN